jgi:hypothetical protein
LQLPSIDAHGHWSRVEREVAEPRPPLAPDAKKIDLGFGDTPGEFTEFGGLVGNFDRQRLDFHAQPGIRENRNAEAMAKGVVGEF